MQNLQRDTYSSRASVALAFRSNFFFGGGAAFMFSASMSLLTVSRDFSIISAGGSTYLTSLGCGGGTGSELRSVVMARW